MAGDKDSGNFKPLKGSGGWGVQPIGSTPHGGDVHDMFRVNERGKITEGHTTARIPGDKQVRMTW